MINTVFIHLFRTEPGVGLGFCFCVFADCTIMYRDYLSLRQKKNSGSSRLHAWAVLDKPIEMTLAQHAYVFFLLMWHHSFMAAWSNCMVLAKKDRIREKTVCERRLTFYSFASDNMTGSHSLYTIYEGHEIMFHVSTMLPFTPDNPQQVTNLCY